MTVYRRPPSFDALMAIHAGLTFVMAGLGAVLIMPTDTFDTSQAWSLFKDTGLPEETYACLLFLIALIGAMGIAPTSRKLRQASKIILAFSHAVLATMFLLGSPHGGAVVPYAAWAMVGLYSVGREARDQR